MDNKKLIGARTFVWGQHGVCKSIMQIAKPDPVHSLAGSFTGTWPNSTSVSGYYATNYQVHSAGSGANVFTWPLSVPSAGTYEVYARWTSHPNRASNAKYTVNHASGATVATVNMELNSGQWNLLGSFSFNAGNTTVSLSDDANDYVIADAVMLVPPGAAPNTATWALNVPSSGSYEVYARWTAYPNRATDAKFTVNHAAGSTPVTANMGQNSGQWNLLGTFGFNSGSITVSLTDQANGYVIADAVMLLPPGSPPNSATWTPNVAQAGQYEVYARWTANPNRATNATYTVTHAGGSTAVPVNQQANGGAWNLLGTFSLASGSAHKVTLTDQANGYVIADAIRLVPVNVQAELKLYFVHPDHLNTPRRIYNQAQQLVWSWDNTDPFGGNPPDENPSGLGTFVFDLRFPGQVWNNETQTAYNYFRDYDPAIGRYIQSDPIGLRGGVNTYLYVLANPLGNVDPIGWRTFKVCGADNGPKFPDNFGPYRFTQACIDHDACYDDCVRRPTKAECDRQFFTDTQNACRSMPWFWVVLGAQRECISYSLQYSIAVEAAGQKAFDDARAKCPTCPK